MPNILGKSSSHGLACSWIGSRATSLKGWFGLATETILSTYPHKPMSDALSVTNGTQGDNKSRAVTREISAASEG